MQAGSRDEDALRVRAVGVGDEDRIARRELVVREPRLGGGPDGHHRRVEKGAQRTSRRRHQRHARRRGEVADADPHVRPIMRESDVADVLVEQLVKTSAGQVHELASPHLAHERVEDAVAIGEERHKSAVRRDRGVHLRAWKIGQPLDSHSRPAIAPGHVRPEAATPCDLERFEPLHQLVGGLPTVGRPFLQTPHHEVGERRRHIRALLRQRRRQVGEMAR